MNQSILIVHNFIATVKVITNNERVQSWKPIRIRNWSIGQFQQVQHELEKWRLRMRFPYSMLQSISLSSHRENISWNQLSFSSGFLLLKSTVWKSTIKRYHNMYIQIHGNSTFFPSNQRFCQKQCETSHTFLAKISWKQWFY